MFPVIHWNLFSLELLITVTLVFLILVDLFLPKDARKGWIGTASYIAIFIIGGFWLSQHYLTGSTFGGMFIMDSLAWFFKGFFLLAMFFVLVMTQQLFK